jgi:putative GTP pyrophosphokinase
MTSDKLTELSRSEVDRLGNRLRSAVTVEDLRLLDKYRRSFASEYEAVVLHLRNSLHLNVSGRPAKSTTAIVDKLKRESIRLSQMQDVAGCRIIVEDITAQDELVLAITSTLQLPISVFDRREIPSHGYRAVHLIVKSGEHSIEIQIRTQLQHLWAEVSEKFADRHSMAVKYGGGPVDVVNLLRALSMLGKDIEALPHAEPLRANMHELLAKIIKENRDIFS